MRRDEVLELATGEERGVPGEDEHVALEPLEGRPGRGGGVTGAPRLLLEGEDGARRERALELGPRLGRRDDYERIGLQPFRRGDYPVDEAPAEQRVQVLRPPRLHAGAETGCHHDRCQRRSHEGRIMAGAGGFEPPVTGPKPAALPLGYAPESWRL